MRSYSFYQWRIWSILALSFVMSLFHRGAMGVISTNLSTDLNASASQLGSIASVTFYTYALMQIPAGLLLDAFGYRKISYLGVLVTGIGSILLGLAPSLTLVFIGRFLVGLGTSVIFISILKAQTVWFSTKDFTKASSRLSFIGNIGGMLATFPLAILVGMLGWRFSMIGMGALCIGVALLIFIYVKNSPREYGFEPQGKIIEKEKVNILQAILSVCKTPALWRNFFALFTLVGCTTTLTGVWGINYLTTVYGLSGTVASFYISFVVFGLIIGSLFINVIAKRFEHQLAMIPRMACTVMAISWFYLLIVAQGKPSLWMLSLLFIIMGFCAMGHIIAFTDILSYCHPQSSGLASSLVNSGEFIGSSIISLVIGFSLDQTFTGPIVEGVKLYSADQFTSVFAIFLFVSLLGIATSYIGTPSVFFKSKSLSVEKLTPENN
ncbi:MAG: MFS transporter [Turicibacter sp.]